ncbi:hypothetical protein HCA31_12120 [Listeria welshimeri]|nr:hypothetical protein [Listeria welshimeri]MBC1469817.1 hypothetical protein [Listeria welshimeri]MBC1763231.1 hypothetical protein [Listeria welshimeri]
MTTKAKKKPKILVITFENTPFLDLVVVSNASFKYVFTRARINKKENP